MADITQNNGDKAGVFTALQESETAGILEYEWKDDETFNITHTEVDPGFNGNGLGTSLIKAAVDFARENGKKIVATCPFANSVLEEDKSTHDVFDAS